MDYWLGLLHELIPTVVEKAVASESHSEGAPRLPDRALGLG